MTLNFFLESFCTIQYVDGSKYGECMVNVWWIQIGVVIQPKGNSEEFKKCANM